ncbi:MAG: ABC transporter permease [Alphaproteobacteria bacterium]|nr:ABC transporter permease [Alphaproteobacteria bacterium]
MADVALPQIGNLTPALLKRQLRRVERLRILRALGLMAPLLLWIIVNFVAPVGIILVKSVDDRDMSSVLPIASDALASWNGQGLPSEAVFAALASDLRAANVAKTLYVVAKRLNAARPGFQALVNRTARSLPALPANSWRDELEAIDARWGETATWRVIQRTAYPVTPIHLLAAVDLTLDDESKVTTVDEERRLFISVWGRTLWVAAIVTLLCVVFGYPLAFLMATIGPRQANLLLILVLLPFWMSLLVRTTAWVVLLQTQGVVNDLALWVGLWSERLQLIHNRIGVYVAMVHVLLPYMVLPLYSTMKRIPPSYLRAAKSLGANPIEAFFRVFLPLTRHGVGSGALLVFILAIGYWVTPALVGGRSDQMISYFIAFYANVTLNWGPAAALSVLLLLLTLAVFWLFKAVFGLDRMRMS